MITPHPAAHAALSRVDRTVRNSRMIAVLVMCTFVLQFLGGLQIRHAWPVAVYDIGAVAAFGVCAAVAAALYRT